MPRVTLTAPEQNAQPYRFALDRKSVSIGRGSENDITVDCGSVSVHHAVMERLEGRYRLRDLGSTNGIKVGGRPTGEIELSDGMSVKIGDVTFDFSLTADEQLALSKERPDEESPVVREQPAPPRQAPPRPAPVPVAPPSPGKSFGMGLLVVLLALAAFYIGLALRYSQETGRSLTPDLKNPPAEAASAEPGEAAE